MARPYTELPWLTPGMSTPTNGVRNGRIAIVLAAVAWSSAGVGQRTLDASPATQIAGRALFAFLTLLVVVAVIERGHVVRSLRSLGRDGVLMAGFLALSSITFFLALNYTTVANVLFLQAAAPMAAALLAWIVLRERISRRTWIAMALAAVGVGVMVTASLDVGVAAVLLPIVMTFSYAVTIVIARYRRDVSMLPATCASQALVLVVIAPFASWGSVSSTDWQVFLALGVFQMGLGLGLLTIGARLIPAAEVALLSMLEVVLAPLWVLLAYGEKPSAATVLGGVIVIAAVTVQATGSGTPAAVPGARLRAAEGSAQS
jgi:drug/metabolite transporter (DMT)-like permease